MDEKSERKMAERPTGAPLSVNCLGIADKMSLLRCGRRRGAWRKRRDPRREAGAFKTLQRGTERGFVSSVGASSVVAAESHRDVYF